MVLNYLGQVWEMLLKIKRFSADGKNIAQNCTTMRVVETMQYWTAASPKKKICNGSSVRKLRLQKHPRKKEKSAGVDNIPAELVQVGGETMLDVLTEVCNKK